MWNIDRGGLLSLAQVQRHGDSEGRRESSFCRVVVRMTGTDSCIQEIRMNLRGVLLHQQ